MSKKLSLRFAQYIILSAVMSFCIIVLIPFNLAVASTNLIPVEEAINRQVCFEVFWEGNRNLRLGKVITMVARQDGNITYVWTDNISVDPGIRQSTYFFTVVSKGSQTLVGEELGFNTDLMRYSPLYQEKIRHVFAHGAVTINFRLPSTCYPRFLPDTRLKIHMLSVIIKSLEDDDVIKDSYEPVHPSALEVIIANFNVGDRKTYAFIPANREVFSIALYDPDNPFNDKSLRAGGFPTLDESGTEYALELIPKIVKYGRTFWIPSGK